MGRLTSSWNKKSDEYFVVSNTGEEKLIAFNVDEKFVLFSTERVNNPWVFQT